MEPYLKNSRSTYSPNVQSPGLRDSPQRRSSQHNRRYSHLRTEPGLGLMRIDEEEETASRDGRYNQSLGMSRSMRNDSLRLPKLVRMTGRNGESGKIK